MKITPKNAVQSAGKTKRKKGASGGGEFSSHLEETKSARSASGAQKSSPVDALLALQEVNTATDEQAKKAHQHGNQLLDMLEEIRHGLLLGAIPKEKLNGIVKLVQQKRNFVTDPKLMDIIDQIELRAKVELAKYGMI